MSNTRDIEDEREALKEHTIVQHRELVKLRAELKTLYASYGRLNESMLLERKENSTLSGTIARAQESEHSWPVMPENTMLRVMGGPHGWYDVPIVKGDTVIVVAKMIANTMTRCTT